MAEVSLPDAAGAPSTHPPSERETRNSLRVSVAAGSIGMLWAAVAFGLPLPMLMESVGATGLQIGLITTVRQLATLSQIPGAFIAERLPARKPFWAWAASIHRSVWFLPAILVLVMRPEDPLLPLLIIATVALSDVIGQASAVSWLSWMADLVPEKISGRFWGFRQTCLTAMALLGAAGAGWLLDLFKPIGQEQTSPIGFALVFSIAAAAGILDVLIHTRAVEPPPVRRKHPLPLFVRLLAPLRNRDYLLLTLAMGAWTFSVGLVASFNVVYLKRDFHVTYSELSSLFIFPSLGAVVSGLAAGYLIDRLGGRAMAAMFIIAGPLFGLSWFLVAPTRIDLVLPWGSTVSVAQPILLQSISGFFAGGFFSGVALCQLRLVAALSPAEGRTMAIAVHWCLVGLMGALGPVIGGTIMDHFDPSRISLMLPFGTPLSFFHVCVLLHIAVALFVATPLMLAIRGREGEVPFPTALRRLFILNPLQAARNALNIYAIGAITPSTRRADAAKQLGLTRTALALEDLIERLDDPSHEVRVETVKALGAIGGPKAVGALRGKLQEPGTLIGLQIIRALRNARATEAAPDLIPLLESPHRDVVAESARTLGVLQCHEAADAIHRLAAHTENPVILAACAEALGSMRFLEAVPALAQRLHSPGTEALHNTLALALAEIGDTREEFYKLLLKDATGGGEGLRLVGESLLAPLERKRSAPALSGAVTATLAAAEKAIAQGDAREAYFALLQLSHELFAERPSAESPALACLRKIQSRQRTPADVYPRQATLLVGHLLAKSWPKSRLP
jgi:MFS family permease